MREPNYGLDTIEFDSSIAVNIAALEKGLYLRKHLTHDFETEIMVIVQKTVSQKCQIFNWLRWFALHLDDRSRDGLSRNVIYNLKLYWIYNNGLVKLMLISILLGIDLHP